MSYAIFFDKDNTTYRLPVNPEQIETASVQAIEKYEVLKLGQIAIPTHMELAEYNFEAEFPHKPLHYVETPGDFKDSDFYLNLFRTWRNNLEPVRFICSNGTGEDINTLVLIEEIKELEKAGEEGDKYLSFKLLEYRKFTKKTAYFVEGEIIPFSIQSTTEVINPKNTGYHVVVSGDTLWGIAKKYYGDGSKYNIIYNANKDKIKNPAVIKIGWKLRIPDKNEFSKYNAPVSSGNSKTSKDRKQELLKMAAATKSSFAENIAGIGVSSSASSSSKKIVIYQSGYNAQGFRGGASSVGKTHSSGGRKF